MKIYDIGDEIWVGHFEMVREREQCPDCFGKLYVTVILGDGTEVQVECQACAKGFNPPTGWVETEYYHVPVVERKKITGVDRRLDGQGNPDITYWFGGNGCGHERCHHDHDTALQMAREDADLWNAKKREKELYLKTKRHETYARNAAYHRNLAKQAEHDLQFHRKKARIMDEKAKQYQRGEPEEDER